MLEALFGNATTEKVLFYVLVHGTAYARELSHAFDLPVSQVQRQLLRLEAGGILASSTHGKTRVFRIDPTYAFRVELEALLRQALTFVPPRDQAPYAPLRRRPRATGKRS